MLRIILNIIIWLQIKITGMYFPFVPVLDTKYSADRPFFSDSLSNLMKVAEIRAKPLLTGFTSDEGMTLFRMSSCLKNKY